MLIIIEGIDRVGKTTLAERISDSRKIKIYKHVGGFDYSKMDNENETDKMIQILEMAKISEATVIFDRFHFTDFVYGCLERHYDMDKAFKNKEEIELILRDMKANLIYVRPTDVNWSSQKHGKSLNRHLALMDMLYDESIIPDKISVDYNSLYKAENKVQEWLNKTVF